MAVIDTTLTPGTTPLSFGSVVFGSGEVPSRLPIGGVEQDLVVVKLAGGGRVVSSNGAQFKPVSWSGEFFVSNTLRSRVQTLRSYMATGQEYALTWWFEQYYAILKSFQPTYRHINRVGYDIEFEITRSANGALSQTSPTSVDSTVSGLMNTATSSYSTILAVDPVASIVSTVPLPTLQQQLTTSGPIAQASASSSAALLASFTSAGAGASSYAATLESTAAQYVPSQQLASALRLIAANIGRGQSSRTIQVQGGSLFAIAAQYYGDASRAFDLAAVNGLASTRLPNGVPTTLALPPFPQKTSA